MLFLADFFEYSLFASFARSVDIEAPIIRCEIFVFLLKYQNTLWVHWSVIAHWLEQWSKCKSYTSKARRVRENTSFSFSLDNTLTERKHQPSQQQKTPACTSKGNTCVNSFDEYELVNVTLSLFNILARWRNDNNNTNIWPFFVKIRWRCSLLNAKYPDTLVHTDSWGKIIACADIVKSLPLINSIEIDFSDKINSKRSCIHHHNDNGNSISPMNTKCHLCSCAGFMTKVCYRRGGELSIYPLHLWVCTQTFKLCGHVKAVIHSTLPNPFRLMAVALFTHVKFVLSAHRWRLEKQTKNEKR